MCYSGSISIALCSNESRGRHSTHSQPRVGRPCHRPYLLVSALWWLVSVVMIISTGYSEAVEGYVGWVLGLIVVRLLVTSLILLEILRPKNNGSSIPTCYLSRGKGRESMNNIQTKRKRKNFFFFFFHSRI